MTNEELLFRAGKGVRGYVEAECGRIRVVQGSRARRIEIDDINIFDNDVLADIIVRGIRSLEEERDIKRSKDPRERALEVSEENLKERLAEFDGLPYGSDHAEWCEVRRSGKFCDCYASDSSDEGLGRTAAGHGAG